MLFLKVFYFYEKHFYENKKKNYNSDFDNMLYKYKNTFNINKLLKITYNFNYKKNSMINKKNFSKEYTYIVKKN